MRWSYGSPSHERGLGMDVRGALQRMFERKMAVEQPVKAKINVQVRIKICNA